MTKTNESKSHQGSPKTLQESNRGNRWTPILMQPFRKLPGETPEEFAERALEELAAASVLRRNSSSGNTPRG